MPRKRPEPKCPIRFGESCTLCFPGADGPQNCGLVYLVQSDPEMAEEFAAVWPQYAVTVYPGGAPCETLHRAPMPGGQCVRGWAGRLYVAAGDTLWYSDALRPHITAPHHNFVRFVGAIRFVEFVQGGAYVGDERGVWWLAGNDPTAWSAAPASSAPALVRSSTLLVWKSLI